MYPTSVPTHSEEIGTSLSTTGSTLTAAGGGGPAAPDLSPQPAASAAITTTSRLPSRERATLTARTSGECSGSEWLKSFSLLTSASSRLLPPRSRSEERRVGKSVDLGGRRIIKKKKKNNDK